MKQTIQSAMNVPGLLIKKNARHTTFILLFAMIASTAIAQQTPLFNTYTFNKFLVNPAFAGIDNEYRAFGVFRSQWGDVPGRPLTGGATVEGSFWKDRIGAGLLIVNDHIGIFNQTEANLAYSQKVSFAKEHQISIGVQGGVMINQVDFNSVVVKDANDPHLADQRSTRTIFDLSVGVGYKWRSLVLGFAMPNIIQPSASYTTTAGDVKFQYLRQYNVFAQYRIGIAHDKFGITPTAMLRKTSETILQLDGTALFDYKKMLFIGGGYRSAYGVIATAGVNVLNMFTVAYSYDHVTQPVISGNTGGSHEITFGFHIASNYKRKHIMEVDVTPQPVVDNTLTATLQKQNDSLVAAVGVKQQKLDSLAKVNAITMAATNEAVHKADSLTVLVNEVTALKTVTSVKGSGEHSFTLDKIFFNFSDHTLLPESKPQLDSLAAFMRQYPNIDIHVNGYSDNIGGAEFNQRLSEERAKAVADYLINSGINDNRLTYKGRGSENPVADNNTEEGRKQNRRVEFVVIKK